MKLRRALPWMGWALTALIVVIGLGFWYLTAQRLRVDEENRKELSHVARDLTGILTGIRDSAKNYFIEKTKKPPSLHSAVLATPDWITDEPPLQKPAPIRPPTSACEELEGRP